MESDILQTTLKISVVKELPICGYCRDCRWWILLDKNLQYYYRDENRPGICDKSVNRFMGVIDHPETLSLAGTDQGDPAILRTSPDFGCVQFEVKNG
jgi:hypothetical protein